MTKSKKNVSKARGQDQHRESVLRQIERSEDVGQLARLAIIERHTGVETAILQRCRALRRQGKVASQA